jgi:predicted ArsR family transcriptional regulator
VDSRLEQQAERYAVLEDPTRRAIYFFVRREYRPVTRDEVADATGISRSLAAFHLERLLDAGLVTADFARPPGRSGPGAGRPAKRYQPSEAEIAIEIPPRRYALAGRLLARAIEEGGTRGVVRRDALRLAADEGRRLGQEFAEGSGPEFGPRFGRRRRRGRRGDAAARVGDCLECLEALGYEPVAEPSGDVALANCPFHALADVARELVCGMNEALVGGVLEGLGVTEMCARLEPHEGRCCVVVGEANAEIPERR